MARIGKILAVGLYFVGTTAVSSEVYVTVAPISELQERVTAEFPASAEPIETSLLSSGISAEILSIKARPGDRLPKGTTVVQLDCRETEFRRDLALQDLKQAEIQLQFSQRQAARIAKLAETNIASEELKDTRATELQQSRVALNASEVELKEAQLQVSRCVVSVPFDAVIVSQLASVGTRVSVGHPILEIVSTAVDIRARVPFDHVIDGTQRVEFQSGQQSVSVELIAESDAVDTGTGTRLLRFQPQTAIDPGTPGVLRMRSQTRVLPADFLVERNRQYGIMTAVDGKAEFIERRNATLGQPVRVTDLALDLSLIREGRFKARHGDTLVIRQ